MDNTIKKNISYQTIYQILTIITPIITAPYLSRILGAKQLGVFSYTSSIVAYFTLFAMLGTVNYGTKVIASCIKEKCLLSLRFFSIYAFQVLTCLAAVILYICFVPFMESEDRIIAYLQSISIIACFVDVNWFLFGLEQFAVITIRNILVKVTTVIAILTLVKSEADLGLYIVIMLGGTLLSNCIAFGLLKKYISFVKISWTDINMHIKPNLKLFFPLLAISVYHIMDKTMLGIFSSYVECGYYYNADKLINIPLCVINGVGIVMLPRISNLIANNKHSDVLKLFGISLEMIIAVGVAMSVGIASISNEFVPFFFGAGFDRCIFLTYVFAPILLIKGIVHTIRMQYLIPYSRDKEFLYSVCIGAITNLVLNLVFIPKYAALGAVIGTLGAEGLACLYQLYNIRNNIDIKVFTKNICIYSILGTILFLCVRACALIDANISIKIILEISTGAVVYGVLVFLYWYYKKRVYLSYILPKIFPM